MMFVSSAQNRHAIVSEDNLIMGLINTLGSSYAFWISALHDQVGWDNMQQF